MKKYYLLFIFGLVVLGFSSCFNDEPITDYSESAIAPVVLIPNGNWPATLQASPVAFDFKAEPQEIKLYARVSWVKALDKDVLVTFVKDPTIISAYNAKFGTDFVELPATAYTTPSSLSVTIPAGSNEANLVIKVNADKIDLSKANMLAFRISDAGSQNVASNFRNIVIPMLVKNIYEANYAVTGYFFHPSAPRGISATKYLATIDGSSGSGQIGDLGGWFFQFTVNPNGKCTNWVGTGSAPAAPASGFMDLDNPAGIPTYPGTGAFDHARYPNTYNASTKTFLFHYGYAGGSTGQAGYTRQVYEKWVRQ